MVPRRRGVSTRHGQITNVSIAIHSPCFSLSDLRQGHLFRDGRVPAEAQELDEGTRGRRRSKSALPCSSRRSCSSKQRLCLGRRPLGQEGATNSASPRNARSTKIGTRLLLAAGSCGTQGCKRSCGVVVPARPAVGHGRSRMVCINGSRLHPARGCAPLGHVSATAWSSQAFCRQKGLNQDDCNRRR